VSCVVALTGLTGAPAERALLVHAVTVPPFDGAAVRTVVEGHVGLGAAPLPGGASGLSQSALLGSGACVTAVFDGRLDGRGELGRNVRPHLTVDPASASDADLILGAYLAWGLDAPAHLLGDFAWCLWDGRERRLLCARDHFGVRPLYFVHTARWLAISNAVTSLRRVPDVSDRLLDRAVGDLLVFGDPQDPHDTMLAAVRRVPAGHRLTWTEAAGPRVSAYWRCAAPPPARVRDPRETIAGFRERLQQAVDDRLRGESATVMMSGGLDSTSVAALAVRAPLARIRAITSVHRTLAHDEEERFAGLAAAALGLPIDAHVLDAYGLFDRWDGDACPVLPVAEPLTAVMSDLLFRASAHGSVVLSGDGGDPLLLPATLPRHLGRMPARDIARGIWQLVHGYRRPPLMGLRSTIRRLCAPEESSPPWLAAPLRAVYDVAGRRRDVAAAARVEPDVLRRESLFQLRSVWWPSLFESQHPAATLRPVDVRYPFFDRRVVEFGLALPSYPWCVNKTILREAMTGLVPDAVRLRPKAPLPFDPVAVRRQLTLHDVVRRLSAAPCLERFVDAASFAAAVAPGGLLLDAEPGTLAALSLAWWLTHAPAAHARSVGAAAVTV